MSIEPSFVKKLNLNLRNTKLSFYLETSQSEERQRF